MERECERCGSLGKLITSGPFAGTHSMSYCHHCSMNLCDDCMKAGKCADSDNGQHLDAEEVEEQ